MRRLRELLAGLAAPEMNAAHGGWPITAVCDDSRKVRSGSLFVAVSGTLADGRQFIADAVRRGATVIVGESLGPIEGALAVNVPDARAALATLAQRWHELGPDGTAGLKLVGITGTNGKSTTAFMVQSVLEQAGWRCGLLGTVHYDLCGRKLVSNMTTPGPLELAGYLRECADAGAQAAVLEVSSHALEQKRAAGMRMSAAAFTNLTGDHLDYHETFERYRAAKARLFTSLDADATAVVNRDDPHHIEMIRDCPARVLTYALDCEADIHATIVRNSAKGTAYRLRIAGRTLDLENALVGRHNVYNALAAAGLALALDVPPETIAAGLAALRSVPGRLQRVPCELEADVFVDYAHTDDALRNVLSVLRPLTARRLLLVFGCGGDRDRTKRPRMARAAAEFADQIFVTNDNPRTEDPQRIIAAILGGFDADALRRVIVEPDRAKAIAEALAAAEAGDVVLLAGKGHETYQVLGAQRVHFDDVEVALHAAAELRRFWPGE